MDWISVEDLLPSGPAGLKHSGIYRVRKSNGDETKAYYYADQIGWISFYGQKTSYWWDKKTKDPLFDVTHWMHLPEPPHFYDCIITNDEFVDNLVRNGEI